MNVSKIAWSLAFVVAINAAFGAVRMYPSSDEPAQEIRLRDGIPNFLAKMAAGKPISVAYLGGSITQMDGWRNGTTKLLKELAPKSAVTEVNAGCGGTGSDLGAFRVGRDALSHNPDLLIVEFATNDGWNDFNFAGSMEGIVRQTWKHNPSTDIVFVYTITEYATNSYMNGKCTAAASTHERVAKHYGIPSVNFGPRVVARLKEGTLLIRGGASGAPAPAVEKTAKGDEAAKCVVFANDGTHPNREGHDIYVESLAAFFKAAQAKAGKPVAHALPKPLVAENLENAKIVPLAREMLSGSWEEVVSDKPALYMSSFGGRMWRTSTPGAKITFAVRGRSAWLYDLVGPDGGQAIVRVDGRDVYGRPLPRFDAYSSYHRIHPLPIAIFKNDKVHVVDITLDSREPSREAIAESKEKPEKYRGTKMWASSILVDGDIVPLPQRVTPAPANDGVFPAQEFFR